MNGSGNIGELKYEESLYYAKARATKRCLDKLEWALTKPSYFRLKIIKLIFPEILKVTEFMENEIFWEESK